MLEAFLPDLSAPHKAETLLGASSRPHFGR